MTDLIESHKNSARQNPTSTDFEFKKSAAAFLSRKKPPHIENTPISILPGTRQKFQIQIENSGQFNFSSTQWKDGIGLEDETDTRIYIFANCGKHRKVNEVVSQEIGLKFIDDIWIIQQYLHCAS